MATRTHGGAGGADEGKKGWRVEALFDVVFKCSDGDVLAHKIRLAEASPVFLAMFTGSFREGSGGSSEGSMTQIECAHIGKEDMTTVLMFAYGAYPPEERYTVCVYKELLYREMNHAHLFFEATTGIELLARISHECPINASPTIHDKWRAFVEGDRFSLVANGVPFSREVIDLHNELMVNTWQLWDVAQLLHWFSVTGIKTKWRAFSPTAFPPDWFDTPEFPIGARVQVRAMRRDWVADVINYKDRVYTVATSTTSEDPHGEHLRVYADQITAVVGGTPATVCAPVDLCNYDPAAVRDGEDEVEQCLWSIFEDFPLKYSDEKKRDWVKTLKPNSAPAWFLLMLLQHSTGDGW